MATISLPTADGLSGQLTPPAAGGSRRRRPLRAATGGAIIVLCALAGALSLTTVDRRQSVLVVTRPVQPGEQLTAADIGVAKISSSGLAVVPASQRNLLLGKAASSRLLPGQPLSLGDISTSAIPSDQVDLPMTLKAGDVPPGLVRGDAVLVVSTPVPGESSGPSAPPVAGTVETVAVQGGFSGSGSTVVSVLVPRTRLVALATAAANGNVVLAEEPGR